MEYMYPMDFEEFLIATNNQLLRDKIKECYSEMKPLPDIAHEKALKLYRQYLCVGGMPEAVNNFIENELDIMKYDSHIISDIIDMYIADMKKYVNNYLETIRIERVYKNIPSQLAKDKKTFKYNFIEETGRKRKYESSIDWLVSAKMILINYKIKKAEIPLKVYINEDSFKLYLSDIGILTNISEINYSDIMLDKAFEYKGAITENYIAQQLSVNNNSLYFWTHGKSAEIDFLLYNDDGIIPIEVKSGSSVKSTSLNTYIREEKPKYSIRISAKNFGYANGIKSIPLYAVFCIQ